MNNHACSFSLDEILSPQFVRQGAQLIYQQALMGKTHFQVHLERLPQLMEVVEQSILKRYPTWQIPYHSRWGHFKVGSDQRLVDFEKNLQQQPLFHDPVEKLKTQWDLVIISVLLDAGAGAQWKYLEKKSGKTWNRSEGLAVASLEMFQQGLFSSDPLHHPWRVDAQGLRELTVEKLAAGMQVDPVTNPLLGLEGRVELLRSLGKTLETEKNYFAVENSDHRDVRRPSHLIYSLMKKESFHQQRAVQAQDVLSLVLRAFHSIWPGRLKQDGIGLGDVWFYPPLERVVAFHKLSQWLTYSLFEPLEQMGIEVQELQALTGLAEYRNGGLFLDGGVLSLREANLLKEEHHPQSELIIEWRALTLVLLDELAKMMRSKLHKNERELPLTKILEGGTWHAGRELAAKNRADASPPLKIKSDGTVF